jgi:two-component system sensor histidine kinase DctS
LGEQAAHAGRIVQRIRQFLTRREPQLEACSLNHIVEGGVALLARELARQRVKLTLVLEPDLPMVVADAVLIEQVVINLVRNATDALGELADFTEASLESEPSRERQIEARTLRTQDHRFVRVDVRDNGPGLQGRRIEALCAPFYSTKIEGMGMGLAICRSILEAHQGALDASEAPGGGALFSMTLPVDLQVTVGALEESEIA